MLEKLREPLGHSKASRLKASWKKIVASILFGMICVTFIFVGVAPDSTGIGTASTAALVNDVVISVADLQERVTQMESQMGDTKGMPAAERQRRATQLRQEILQQMVSNELLFQSAEKAGVLPTKAAIRDLIVNVPFLQEEGRFSRDRYNQYLQYRNMTAAQFELRLKKDVVVRQVQQLFITAMKQPKSARELEDELKSTTLSLEFVKFDPASLAVKRTVANTEIDQFLAVTENKKKVSDYYNANKQNFTRTPEVRARHILIKGADDAALNKIKDIQQELKTADFADLAKKYSEDEGSKNLGGDLKFFGRGAMVKEFEDVAFKLAVGQVSEPVKTDFGYHLIKVEEKRGGETDALDKVERDIAHNMIKEGYADVAMSEIREIVKTKGDVSGWIAKNNLKWTETGDFSLDQQFVPNIGPADEVMQAAMKIKKPGDVAGEVVMVGSQRYILRLKKLARNAPIKKGIELPEYMQAAGGAEVIGLWADALKKDARIIMNGRAL